MNIIPTLLTTSTGEFIVQIEQFQKYYQRIQLDVTDGHIVPNLTTQIAEIIDLVKSKIVILEPTTLFDFHLMVEDYEGELEKIKTLQDLGMNVNLALVHALKYPNIPQLMSKYNFAIGLDVFPSQTVADLSQHNDLKHIPSIQLMTVTPGFQGSPFLPDMLHKIEQLRTQDYKGEIMIDGGVNDKSIETIKTKVHKPDYLCIGSYLTKAGDNFEERVHFLKTLN